MQQTPNPAEFVKVIAPAVARAAAIARELEGLVANNPKTGESSDVKAALTVADTAAQEVILEAVLAHYPDVSLRAEEDTPLVHRFPEEAPATVVLDPIDGTLQSYLHREGPYGVMVGLAVAREYRAAIVALPREGYEFYAARGDGAFASFDGGEARPTDPLAPSGSRILVSHGLPDAARRVLEDRGYETQPACGGAVSVAPLLPGVRAGLRVAVDEAANISIRGRIGALIAREAGATILRETGEPFPTDIETPCRALMVGSDAADLEALQAAVAAIS